MKSKPSPKPNTSNRQYLMYAVMLIVGVIIAYLALITITAFNTAKRIQRERAAQPAMELSKKYEDATVNLEYPSYLSDFAVRKDDQLVSEQEKVASFFQASGQGVLGRSFWLILHDPYPNTTEVTNISAWIKQTGKDIFMDEGKKYTLTPSEMVLGDASVVVVPDFNPEENRGETAYFMTSQGLRSLQIWSWTKNPEADYQVYREVLQSLKIK